MVELESDNEGGGIIYILVGLFVIILILAIVGYFLFPPIKGLIRGETIKEEVVITYTEMFLSAEDNDGKQLFLEYELKENNSIVQRGLLKDGILEKFSQVREGYVYPLTVSGEGYYTSTKTCGVTTKKCVVVLQKKGKAKVDVVQLKEDKYRGLVYVEDGIIKQPELCVTWKGLLNVELDVPVKNIPTDDFWKYDKCYGYSYSFENDFLYEFDIITTSLGEGGEEFTLFLVDKCSSIGSSGCSQGVEKIIKIG